MAYMGERRGTSRFLAGRLEGNTPLRITRRRWEDNIKKNLQEVGKRSRDRTDRTYDRYSTVHVARLVNAVIKHRVT